jgi:hypothetical protein
MFFFTVDRVFKLEQLIFCEEPMSAREVSLYYNSFRSHHKEFDLYRLYFGVSGGMLGI